MTNHNQSGDGAYQQGNLQPVEPRIFQAPEGAQPGPVARVHGQGTAEQRDIRTTLDFGDDDGADEPLNNHDDGNEPHNDDGFMPGPQLG